MFQAIVDTGESQNIEINIDFAKRSVNGIEWLISENERLQKIVLAMESLL